MNVVDKKWIRFRIYLVEVLFLIGLGIIIFRAYQLQVIQREHLKSIARAGYLKTKIIPSKRGTIYDREGKELALSIEVTSVYAHPKYIKDKKEAAIKLAPILGRNRNQLMRILNKESSFIWLNRKISSDLGKQVKDLSLQGIVVVPELRSYYPARETGSHLIGFVGADNQGLEGLEKKYDHILKGSPYRLTFLRDACRRAFSVTQTLPFNNGVHDLVLTIDQDLQYNAQKALKKAVKRSRAVSGQCLVVNPANGEILAMAIVPEFDPNNFSRCKPSQWRNRAITDVYEPGSTMKAFLLAASLQEKVVSPLTLFDCEQGEFKIGNNIIHDTHEAGILNVADIIKTSSNIGAVKIGQELGYKKFYEYLKKFGFGEKTNIDLIGERNGFLRGIKSIKPIEEINMYFGQGMTITSLQLAMAMSVIANGGKLMKPYVVKKIIDENGKVEETKPRVIREVISRETALKVTHILEGVATEDGTGVQAAIMGFTVAGKTGTSQKVNPKTKRYSRRKHIATFVGFVPSDRPKMVIAVIIDEPRGIPFGGYVAGPVFKEVGQWALNHFRINPSTRFARNVARSGLDKQLNSPPPPPDPIRIKAGSLPSLKGLGMREVLNKGRALGIKVVLKGSGLAFRQEPAAGSALKGIRSLKVYFKSPT